MTVVQIINKLTEWVDEKICSQVWLKQPPSAELNPVTRIKEPINHKVNMVHPECFPIFIPAKDRMKPEDAPSVPSICVQPIDCSDDLIRQRRYITVRLCFATWNPGYQSDEMLVPREALDKDIPRIFHLGAETKEYIRKFDGWKDVWNLIDKTLREIEGADSISGMSIVLDNSIEYGLFQEDGLLVETYPYWNAWLKFRLECGLVRAVSDDKQQYL